MIGRPAELVIVQQVRRQHRQDVAIALQCSITPTHLEIYMQTLGGMDGSRLSAREFVFGDGCFFLKGVAPPDVTMEEIFASCGPWMGLQLVALILVMLFPEIALWLPRVAG
jgi:hypothetical protein